MHKPLLAGAVFALATVTACTSGGTPTPAAPPATQAAPATSSMPAEPTITIAAVGDILMGSAPDKLPPDGGRGFFARVAEPLSADLTMGNLETPLSDPTGFTKCQPPASTQSPASPATPAPPSGCYAFRLPPSYAGVLREGGFHVLNLANNHTNDAGAAGLRNTRAALSASSIKATGGVGEIATHQANGITVAVLGFGPYSWMQSVHDTKAAVALVRKAGTQADLVVVNMHVGAEGAGEQHVRPGTETFLGENRGDPIAFAHAVVDAGADLVVGHSPHVLRGMEFYKGRLVAYSMGNFAGYRVLNASFPLGIGGVLRATLRKDGTWAGGALVGTAMVDGGLPALDARRRALTLVRDLSNADLPRSAVTLSPDGTLTP